MNAEYWDKSQAAAYLGVSPHAIDYLVRTRVLAFYLIVGKRRFRREDLDRYALANRYDATVAASDSIPSAP